MFCKFCGNNITGNPVVCPYCGKEQGPLVDGNGFWDLCDTPQPVQTPQPAVMPEPAPSAGTNSGKGRKNKTSSRVMRLLSLVFPASAVVGLIFVGMQVGKVGGQVEELKESVTEIKFSQEQEESALERLIADVRESRPETAEVPESPAEPAPQPEPETEEQSTEPAPENTITAVAATPWGSDMATFDSFETSENLLLVKTALPNSEGWFIYQVENNFADDNAYTYYISSDGGVTWKELTGTDPYFTAKEETIGNYRIAAAQHAAASEIALPDNGEGFDAQDTGLVCDPVNDGCLYSLPAGFAQFHLWQTSEHGSPWTNVSTADEYFVQSGGPSCRLFIAAETTWYRLDPGSAGTGGR